MRRLLTLWAFYVLALTALPCSDAGNQCRDDGPKVSRVQSHDHEHDKDDNCAPFCYCSCCSVSFTTFDFKLVEVAQPKVAFTDKKIALRDHQLVSKYYGNIWNPPKLAA